MSFFRSKFAMVSADLLSETAVESTPWLWESYLAAGLISLLTSRWKSGKTTLVSLLLSRMRHGGELAGSPVFAGRTIVVSEETVALWAGRAQRLQIGAETQLLSRPFRGRPSFEQWLELIDGLAAEKPDLVVIDPLAMFLPGVVENSAAAMLNVLDPLRRLTDVGAAVLILHHPRKGTTANDLSPRGTGALQGFVDILIELDRPPNTAFDDRRRRLRAASRLQSATQITIELNAVGTDYALCNLTPEPDGFDLGWPVVQLILQDAPEPLTRRQIFAAWSESHDRPSVSTLKRWLDKAAGEGLMQVEGPGTRHGPFRYGAK